MDSSLRKKITWEATHLVYPGLAKLNSLQFDWVMATACTAK